MLSSKTTIFQIGNFLLHLAAVITLNHYTEDDTLTSTLPAGTMLCLEKMSILSGSGINPLHNGAFSLVYCLLFIKEFISLVIFLFIFNSSVLVLYFFCLK